MQLLEIEKKTINKEKVNTVNAYKLWKVLENDTDFDFWIQDCIGINGYKINVDYLNKNNINKEIMISLDMAKGLIIIDVYEAENLSTSMRLNDIRRYLVKCDKKLPPKTYKEALKEIIKVEEEKERELKKVDPAVWFAEEISSTAKSLRISEYAKLLSDTVGIEIDTNELYAYFKNKGYFEKKNDFFEFKTERPEYHIILGVPYITGKGQLYLKYEVLSHF